MAERAVQRQLWALIRANLTLVLSIGASGLALARILSATDYDLLAAVAVVRYVGLPQVALTLVVQTVPLLVLFAFGAAVAWTTTPGQRARERALGLAWAIALGVATFVMLPLPDHGWLFVCAAVLLTTTAIRLASQPSERPGVRAVTLALVLYLVPVTASPVPLPFLWLPAEHVGLNDGTSRVGHVLSDGERWTVLLDHLGKIEHVRSDSLLHRSTCLMQGARQLATLAQWSSGEGPVAAPRCPRPQLVAEIAPRGQPTFSVVGARSFATTGSIDTDTRVLTLLVRLRNLSAVPAGTGRVELEVGEGLRLLTPMTALSLRGDDHGLVALYRRGQDGNARLPEGWSFDAVAGNATLVYPLEFAVTSNEATSSALGACVYARRLVPHCTRISVPIGEPPSKMDRDTASPSR